MLAGAVAAGAGPPKPKPKPRVELRTGTEQGVLRKKAIKLRVSSRRGDRVGVEAQFVVDGYPEDYPFHLGPEHARLRDREANVRFDLSARQVEVLDFAIKTCRGANLDITATVNGRKGALQAGLRRPKDC